MKLLMVVLLSAFTVGSCNAQTTALGEPVAQLDKRTWIVYHDSKGGYWFGADGAGVYHYHNKALTRLTARQGWAGGRVREITEDGQGNIYINTLEGVSKYDGKRLTRLTPQPDNSWKLQPGDVWLKSEHGALRYDGKVLHALKFPKSEREDDYYRRFPGTPIDPYDVYYVYRDRKGHMWFGTGAMGAYRYDGKTITNLYEPHLTDVPNGGSFGIRSILEDRNGLFWLCNSKYRYQLLPGAAEQSPGYVHYTRKPGFDFSDDALGGDRLYFQSAAEDAAGNLWLQTYMGGIWKYDGRGLTQYPVLDGKVPAKVVSLFQDRKGGLWLGTDGSGVYRYDGKGFVRFEP